MDYPFTKNNIRFRMVSSKALEHFYSFKGYLLAELLQENNQFSEPARETLLLLYNSYSHFLQNLEHQLLRHQPNVQGLVEQVHITREKTLHLLHANPDVFLPEFLEHFLAINHSHVAAFLSMLEDCPATSIEAFPYVVCKTSAYIQTAMYEMYEIDCLLGSNFVEKRLSTNETSFNSSLLLYVDNFSIVYYNKTGIFCPLLRAQTYNSWVGRQNVVVKDYGSIDIVGESPILKINDFLNVVSVVQKEEG